MGPAGHTYAFRDRSLPAALDAIAALGLDRVEVWLGHVPGAPDGARRELERRGLTPVAVCAGGLYDPGADTLARALALAAAVEVSLIVACVEPSALPSLGAQLPDGVVLCVENHWDQPLARASEVLAAIDGDERLAACLDTGHALLAGADPARFASELGGRLGHVHLKDARRPTPVERLLGRRLRRRLLSRPEPVSAGRGALDVALLHAALAQAGYDGAVSLEAEHADAEDAVAALAHLRDTWTADEPFA
jgi:inosose dehydratase